MAAASVQRRLAAILAADVVGYARLIGADEAGTRARFNVHLDELIKPGIARHHGRLVKTTGDGLLVEFPSAVDAVECAGEIQKGMMGRNVGVADERRLEFRIGVNLGDVIVEGDDIHGEGVNVAARLEGLAETGGICISGGVFELVRNRVDAGFEDLGEQHVKNVSAPVRVYAVRPQSAATLAAGDMAIADKPSIAVLPFQNMSGDPEQEYFADGLTEDIITALSCWRSFSVIARNSTFAYKGTSPDVREVASHLGVRYVLEGSVRRAGDRVRISAQLIEGATGNHVWAEKYDRKLDDFFDLQDEITQVIAAKVEPEFARAEQKRAAQKPPSNLAAWECYQRGVASLDEVTKEGNRRARDFFERAIELDPADSRSHAGMAYSLFRYVLDGYSEPGENYSDKIIEFARRAITLDDADALAHHTLAVALLYFSDKYDLSIAEARRAVEINPNFSQAHVPLGNALSFVGKPEEGIAHLETALRLNPDDNRGHIYWAYLAEAHLNNRDYEQAAVCARKGVERKSDYAYSYFVLASALGHLGDTERASAALAESLRIQPEYVEIHRQIHRYRDPADREHILAGLRAAGLPE